MLTRVFLTTVVLCAASLGRTEPTSIDQGYRQMYNLQFDAAHRTFGEWQRQHPADPLGPVSDAAAYLFAEFDRLKVLQSEFFVEDGLFRKRPKLTPDPTARRLFDDELSK